MKRTSGRKIIYVGDFDGANTPIELSWRNEVIWIAPESRYKRFLSHSWVKYDETKYKGAFIRVFNMDDIMKGLKRVLGGARWIDMCKKMRIMKKTRLELFCAFQILAVWGLAAVAAQLAGTTVAVA